jgi:hypothetical protein
VYVHELGVRSWFTVVLVVLQKVYCETMFASTIECNGKVNVEIVQNNACSVFAVLEEMRTGSFLIVLVTGGVCVFL